MLYTVHRVALNDPALTVVDFTNLPMPKPEEPRVAPKLGQALRTNTHVQKVLLNNTVPPNRSH